MKIVDNRLHSEVIDHWGHLDGEDKWNNKLVQNLPTDIQWYGAQIEEEDINRTYVIKAMEWVSLLGDRPQDFHIQNAVRALNNGSTNEHVRKILKIKQQHSPDYANIDKQIIVVSPNMYSTYTIIDGNHRAICLHSDGCLVGNQVYFGVSPGIARYLWAWY